jgi:cytochrome c oxidase subunit IV
MIGIEALPLSGGVAVFLLASAMMIKATLIAGWFMHLKSETRFIMWCLVLGTLLTAAFLLFLLVPDGMDANRLAEYP